MLKACWDCIVGQNINTEGPYGTQLNGGIVSAPMWPQGDNNMFLIPKRFDLGDQIHILGTLASNATMLTVSLVRDNNGSPDYQNILCQLEIYMETHPNNPNQILIKSIENGSPHNIHTFDIATSNFVTISDFKVGFVARSQDILDILLNDNDMDQVQTQDLTQIRYIMVKGDLDKVHNLSFQFA